MKMQTMTSLNIRHYGDPCLRKKSQPVKDIGPSERLLVSAMLEAMYANKGIGLAAPQAGINQQIFVADIGDGPMAVFNPKILKKTGTCFMEEGCLSLPGVTVNVRRPEKILIRYMDENGRTVEKTVSDLLARVFLHETDHLMGKLIHDYAGWRGKKNIRKQLKGISTQPPTNIL